MGCGGGGDGGVIVGNWRGEGGGLVGAGVVAVAAYLGGTVVNDGAVVMVLLSPSSLWGCPGWLCLCLSVDWCG